MRRAAICRLTAMVLALAGARALRAQWIEDNSDYSIEGFVDPSGEVSWRRARQRTIAPELERQQRVQLVLRSGAELQKGDAWAWRNAIEERLVSLGDSCIPAMRSEMESREGYEADALEVAIFRLENPGLDPKEALADWAQKRFNLSPANEMAQVKITRVLGIGGEAEPGDEALFRHHLFYCAEFVPRHVRVPVALAADGKVQALEEDGALLAFIEREVKPQRSEVGRQRLALAVARLAIARAATIYKPDGQRVTRQPDASAGGTQGAAGGATWVARVDAGSVHQTASVAFSPDGKVVGLKSSQEKIAEAVTPPVSVPTPTAPPPPMPMLDK